MALHVCRQSMTPTVVTGHETECQDDQTDKFYKVGETWATLSNNCKSSTCVRENNALYIDRVSCVTMPTTYPGREKRGR